MVLSFSCGALRRQRRHLVEHAVESGDHRQDSATDSDCRDVAAASSLVGCIAAEPKIQPASFWDRHGLRAGRSVLAWHSLASITLGLARYTPSMVQWH